MREYLILNSSGENPEGNQDLPKKDYAVTRREFLKAGVFGLAWLAAAEVGAEGSKAPRSKKEKVVERSSEELLQLKNLLDPQVPSIQAELANIEDALRKIEQFEKRYVEKYGSAENPKLTLHERYTFKRAEYNLPETLEIKKDAKYFERILQLYKLSSILSHLPFEEMEHIDELFPDVKKHLAQLSEKEKIFVSEKVDENTGEATFGTQEIKSVKDFLRLQAHLAEIEMKELRHVPFTVWSLADYHKFAYEFEKEFPEYARYETDVRQVKKILDPHLAAILEGYPERWPEVVIMGSRKDFLALPGVTENTGAFHSEMDDKIVMYREKLYEQIENLSHESGHVVARNGEISLIAYQKELRSMRAIDQDMLILVRACLENIEKLLSGLSPALAQKLTGDLNKNLEKYRLLNMGARKEIIEQSAARKDVVDRMVFQKGSPHTQLDETGAYLFQDVVLSDIAAKNPRLGTMLLKIRDYHAWVVTQDVDHFGAYKLAEELKMKYRGDSLKALKEIMYLKDEEKIERYQETIADYNMKYKVGQPALLAEVFGVAVDFEYARAHQEALRELAILQALMLPGLPPENKKNGENMILNYQKKLVGILKDILKPIRQESGKQRK